MSCPPLSSLSSALGWVVEVGQGAGGFPWFWIGESFKKEKAGNFRLEKSPNHSLRERWWSHRKGWACTHRRACGDPHSGELQNDDCSPGVCSLWPHREDVHLRTSSYSVNCVGTVPLITSKMRIKLPLRVFIVWALICPVKPQLYAGPSHFFVGAECRSGYEELLWWRLVAMYSWDLSYECVKISFYCKRPLLVHCGLSLTPCLLFSNSGQCIC